MLHPQARFHTKETYMSSNFQLGIVGKAPNQVCTSGRWRFTSFTSMVHSNPFFCSCRICLYIFMGKGPNCCCHPLFLLYEMSRLSAYSFLLTRQRSAGFMPHLKPLKACRPHTGRLPQ